MSQRRSTKDGPFCWLSKAALRRIRDVAGESNQPSAASVIAVYTGLCELASDSQAESFEASRGNIAGKACVNVRTADACLLTLVKCALVRVDRRRIDETTNLPSLYTLLSYGSEIKPRASDLNAPLVQRSKKAPTAPLLKNTEELEESIAPAKPTRNRNPLLDTLAVIDGSDLAQITSKAWGAIRTALKEIREVCPDVSPDEINRRAAIYRHRMPGAMLTANALAKHWAKCDRSSLPNQSAPQPERHYPAFST